MNNTALPPLTIAEQERVTEMSAHIAGLIQANKAPISFKRFMQEALYAKDLGYYVSNKTKLGEQGDFMTAPMSSRLFGQTFARQFAKILQRLGEKAVIVEFGAGTGKFALDCLQQLKARDALPYAYYIVEVSPDLRRQQQIALEALGDFYPNIHWVLQLPNEKMNAIVFANEVLDAMPIELVRFCYGKPLQMMVDYQQGEFVWCENKTPEVSLLENLSCLPPGTYSGLPSYQTELNTWVTPWLKSVRDMLNSGVIFICDYGYQRDLYYSQPRIRGTLQCYYKHHVHDNPLIYAGVQDITAHVDFTAVAEAAEQLGFTLDGFATQGNFLSKAGILDTYQDAQSGLNEREILHLNQEMKLLTLSTELAENFKVIALSYEYDEVIEAFDEIDVSYLL